MLAGFHSTLRMLCHWELDVRDVAEQIVLLQRQPGLLPIERPRCGKTLPRR